MTKLVDGMGQQLENQATVPGLLGLVVLGPATPGGNMGQVSHRFVGGDTRAIFIKHLREKLKLMDNFGTELKQNQSTIHLLKITVG